MSVGNKEGGNMSRNGKAEKVSVIIPLYNRSDFIRQTVTSVLQQTLSDFRLYVVDDGSTDNSREIVESIEDERVVVMEHPGGVNKGQSAAINLGLEAAQGEYIAILDSDDYWERDKLEIQVDFLEKHPDVGLVYCNGICVDEKNNFLYHIYKAGHLEHNDPGDVLMDCYFLLPNNSLVRSSLFKTVGGFDESYRSAQDHDMAIRISEVTNIAYIDKSVFAYRRHKNSISHKNALLRWRTGFAVLKKAKSRYPYSSTVIRKRKAVLYFRLGQCYLENKCYLSSFGSFVMSGLHDPFRALRVLLGNEKISSPH